jgi:hypothetical protein
MAKRFANPFPRFFNDTGALLPSGTIDFFEAGSTVTRKDTYSDSLLTTANANPVILSAGGVIPNIWLDGNYDIVLKDRNGNQIDQADDVGSSLGGVFDNWSSSLVYGDGGDNIVTGSDGLYYLSIQASNAGNDPLTSPTYWSEIKLTGVYNANQTYGIDDIVVVAGASMWVSLSAANTGNTPSSSPTKWGPVIGYDQTIKRINLQDYGEITNAIGSVGGGSQTLDLTLGNSVTATVDTSETTFVFSNATASDELCGFTLYLTNGGSQTVNWPASVDFAGATAPTLTASGVDVLVFETVDGGTIWNGFVAALNMS